MKKFVPRVRSQNSMIAAPVREGRKTSWSSWALRTVQTKTGIRKNDMPGARSHRIVVTKFTAAIIEEIPSRIILRHQKS